MEYLDQQIHLSYYLNFIFTKMNDSEKKKNVIQLLLFLLALITATLLLIYFSNKKSGGHDFKVDSNSIPIIKGKASFALYQHTTPLSVSTELLNKPIPTNRIWSSAVFSEFISGGYFLPYAINSNSQGLQIGVPHIVAGEKTVRGLIGGEYLTIKPSNGEISFSEVIDYSDLTVTIRFFNNDSDQIFDATFIQGSPYIFIHPYTNELAIEGGVYLLKENNQRLVAVNENHTIGFFTNSNYDIQNEKEAISSNTNGNLITLGVYTDDDSEKIVREYSKNEIVSIVAQPTLALTSANLTYNFNYANGSEEKTVWGLLPHHFRNNRYDFQFEIPTIRGIQKYTTLNNQLVVSFPKSQLHNELKNNSLADEQINLLKSMIELENESSAFELETTYFGGKRLARAARIIQISREIGAEELADNMRERLTRELVNWFTYTENEQSKHFKYDTKIKGLIGEKTEFGSEDYNDHHFHYAYFLYAASVIAQENPDFLTEYGDFVDLIARDFASWEREDPSFPYVRVYDWYENHSWASGFQKELDGNNQESTSEAINAWYSLWMWSLVRKNVEMKDMAEFLYSSEIQSTKTYWLNRNEDPDSIGLFPPEYKYPKASLIWGGKYEYSTFFSQDPLAIDGIQYLPLTPGSTYLKDDAYVLRDKEFIFQRFNSSNGEDAWQDINLMYYATIDGSEVASIEKLLTVPIDDGNSRTNLLYWIFYWGNIIK